MAFTLLSRISLDKASRALSVTSASSKKQQYFTESRTLCRSTCEVVHTVSTVTHHQSFVIRYTSVKYQS